MKRPDTYSIWLLADVSLDRAASILPLLGLDRPEHEVLQRCIDATAGMLTPGTDKFRLIADSILDNLSSEPVEERSHFANWLRDFCFTDEASRPDLHYWSRHLLDLLAVEPAPAPEGVEPEKWRALQAAYRGRLPAPNLLWSDDFSRAAEITMAQRRVEKAFDEARAQPLSPHDLEVYLRFGWNDHGNVQGLASLEIGARLGSVREFWRAVTAQVPAAALEKIAFERDMAIWRSAANLESFKRDAELYGVTPEQMAADIFPKPTLPPALNQMLEG
jgi:hypothetical protein